jgi:hypothetical protein
VIIFRSPGAPNTRVPDVAGFWIKGCPHSGFFFAFNNYINKKFWEELIPTFHDATRAALKKTRPTILLLLRVYSLPL